MTSRAPKMVTYLGRPGRDPETDLQPVPRVHLPLRAGVPRLFDDGLARAAGYESGADFADMVVTTLGAGHNPPIFKSETVSKGAVTSPQARRNAARRAQRAAAAARKESAGAGRNPATSEKAQSADEGA